MAAQEMKAVLSSKTKFVGLASDTLPHGVSLTDIEELEFDTLIALEEEPRAGVDWHDHTNCDQGNEMALSSTTMLFEVLPFYLDSGTTIHISPDWSNFTRLQSLAVKFMEWEELL